MLPRALLLASAAHAASHLYVSPAGSDAGDGSAAAPFATFVRAQAAARALAPSLTADLLVHFRTGAYFQNATIALTTADSGASASARIRYTGGWPSDPPGGAPPTIHAGAAVAGWVQAAPGIWSAPLPAGVLDTRQVFNASAPAGQAALRKAAAGGLGAHASITATGYTAIAANCPFLTDPAQSAADVEFVYTGVGSSWTESRMRVASIAPLAGGLLNITMAQPAWSFHTRAYGQALTFPASTANVHAGLAASPGAFYVNSATRTLYVSGGAAAPAGLVVPSLDMLMELRGDSADAPLRWVSFEGLAFSFAGWLEPNQGLGYVDMQSGYRIVSTAYSPDDDDKWLPVPGNVQVHEARNISFAGCSFAGLGATALAILDSSQSVSVTNSNFTDVSCAGIGIGQVSDINTTVARENGYFVLDSNLFSNIPVEYHDCPAILGGYVVGSAITNNAILNNSNGGICVGWGWSRDEAVNAGWNTIARNYIYRSNWLLEDCGSIYVLGPQPESLMSDNFLSGQVKLFGALYTDEGSAYWHITKNVVHNVPEWLHIWTSSIHDELVDDNWSDQTCAWPAFAADARPPHLYAYSAHSFPSADQDVHGTRCVVANNTFLPPGTPLAQWPAEAQAIMAASGPAWWTGARI